MFYTIFETALGEFALVWGETGLRRVFLPGDYRDAMVQRLEQLGATVAEPDRRMDVLANRIEDYAEGIEVDFSDTALDLSGVPEFHRRCYDLLLTIPWGQTTTYGEMARRLGDVNLSRAVGQAMGANPLPLVIPCHRVLAAGGGAGGFSAPGGAATKRVMLALEGVRPGSPPGQMQFAF